jgi:hypothetical protein
MIVDEKIDILILTETWLHQLGDESKIASITPDGYLLQHHPRTTSPGGGIAIIYREHLKIKVCNDVPHYQSIETFEYVLTHGHLSIRFLCLYRPPPSKSNKLTSTIFHSEITSLMNIVCVKSGNLVLIGDINVHFDNRDHPDTKKMLQLLSLHSCQQHVSEPTHKNGHTIDWVVTRESENCVQNVLVKDLQMSDHYLVTVNLSATKPSPITVSTPCRNIKKIDESAFRQDLEQSRLITSPPSDCEDLADLYNAELTRLLDKHAPEKLKSIHQRPKSTWLFTPDVAKAKADRRKAERQWRKSNLEVHRQIYVNARNTVSKIIAGAKQSFFNNKILESTSNPKQLYSTMFDLMGKKKDSSLPSGEDPALIAQSFSDFFQSKIVDIRTQLHQSQNTTVPHDDHPVFNGKGLDYFLQFSENDVLTLLNELKPTFCTLDPIPTKLVLKYTDLLLPSITMMVNSGLMSGTMPASFKRAIVKPLLKKNGLDHDILNNYRPVSNLPFMSKLVEKAVLKRLSVHLRKCDLYEPFQSAYRQYHSTETALLRVVNDIRSAVDKGNVSLLLLLDLSAAFDTIDHQILLSQLRHTFGLDGPVWNWFESYLSERYQSVCVNGSFSEPIKLTCGVPQGSILGPVLFTLYTRQLGQKIENHNIQRHFYADDTQLINSFIPSVSAASMATDQLNDCCSDIKSWMTLNMLKLNDDKTEAMLVGPVIRRAKSDLTCITVGTSQINLSPVVKDLGVMLDNELTMEKHVNHLCKVCSYQLRNIGCIRRYITKEATIMLILALISSRLDYCNSLLIGAPKQLIHKLQIVQNTAARIISLRRKYDHITPVLQNLHWLPIEQRITFKILCLTYQCVSGTAPAYLTELVQPYSPGRSLRSVNQMLLNVPKVNSTTYGHKTFAYAAPTEWNNLPLSLKNSASLDIFKSQLKTTLFKRAYSQ